MVIESSRQNSRKVRHAINANHSCLKKACFLKLWWIQNVIELNFLFPWSWFSIFAKSNKAASIQKLIRLISSVSVCYLFHQRARCSVFCPAMLTICKSKHLVTCILIESIPSILCMYMRSHIPLQVESVSNTHFLPKTFRETQNHASFFANYEILFDFWAFVRQYFILFEL